MRILFVHGMGRSPLSAWPMLRRLRREGLDTSTFAYGVSRENFPVIRDRLVARIRALAGQGDYVLIGHSLGGVLLRAALNVLPATMAPPCHLFLLGSPVKAARLAARLQRNPIYRRITGDCGQRLASDHRMQEIGPVAIATTSIVGTRGITMAAGPFDGEPNDGVVSLSEVSASWIDEQIDVPLVHTWLPSSPQVARMVLRSLDRRGLWPSYRHGQPDATI